MARRASFEVAHLVQARSASKGNTSSLSGFHLRKLDKLSIPSLALRACIWLVFETKTLKIVQLQNLRGVLLVGDLEPYIPQLEFGERRLQMT